ncbi:MAG: hypothetical protein RLZZ427_844 [Pseudomonadota bacterium]|jgi:hypothetical protein
MTIRFAAARPRISGLIGRSPWPLEPPRASNDNAPEPKPEPEPEPAPPHRTDLLRAALLHFAVHGLGAAAEARLEALRCHARHQTKQALHWLAICRQFDRRMAAALARKLALKTKRQSTHDLPF